MILQVAQSMLRGGDAKNATTVGSRKYTAGLRESDALFVRVTV
jgi:3-oxoacyl-[acyl-carrier-protein] synthase III